MPHTSCLEVPFLDIGRARIMLQLESWERDVTSISFFFLELRQPVARRTLTMTSVHESIEKGEQACTFIPRALRSDTSCKVRLITRTVRRINN